MEHEYILSGDALTVAVRPDLGGRIDRITDLETGKNWLWHPAWYRGEPRRLAVGASFDANWSGGWDEVFPNDAACEFQGRKLPDHGELWSQSWRVTDASASALTLAYSCSSVPVFVEKRIAVGESGVKVRYIFNNGSEAVLPFLFKLHSALAVEAGDEILLPSCAIEPVDTGFSTIIGRAQRTSFPVAYDTDGAEVRVDAVPGPEAGKREFFYATGLIEPWCAVKNSRTSRIFSFTFDGKAIPYVWVFASYGGWNGHYVLILEPCTNVPYDLETACGNGTCALLGPNETKQMVVNVHLSNTAVTLTHTKPPAGAAVPPSALR